MFTRSIRPPDDVLPNPNDPADVPPATVGPPAARPGDPHGVVFEGDVTPATALPRIVASPWSGWPSEWNTPSWSGAPRLTDTAWMCLDLNSRVLSTMPPYLVGAAPSRNADWLNNPDPDLYFDWSEFAKQLFWDFQAVGEVFVLATARYSDGMPARFHVVPPWMVNVEMDSGFRRYSIGEVDVTADIRHLRYTSTIADARGHGPLEAGAYRLVAADVLTRYATTLVGNGGIPTSILEHPDELTPQQSADLRAQWVQARLSSIGEPAVLSGGVQWRPVQLNPSEMALTELSRDNGSFIAYLLGVPAPLIGLPSGQDSLTYNTLQMILMQHWRTGLRPFAQTVMNGLSNWLLPRGTRVELNRDDYIAADPLQRAQVYQILSSITDPATGKPVLSVDEIRGSERLDNSTPDLPSGVLR